MTLHNVEIERQCHCQVLSVTEKISLAEWSRERYITYKTVVRPTMVYGAETWAAKKAEEKNMALIQDQI